MPVSFERAQELAGLLTTAGLRVAVDSRSVNTPCALLTPPIRTYELSSGFTAEWHIWLLAPGEGTADSWVALDTMLEILENTLPLETVEPGVYPIATGAAPVSGYDCVYRESLRY